MRVHVVVPDGFDNPGRPTGGNIYDRRVCAGLAEAGWDVRVTTVAAAWPVPGPVARADLTRIVAAIPDGEAVLLVAPSRAETYGMAVTEALAHGLPVLAAAVGGLPDWREGAEQAAGIALILLGAYLLIEQLVR